MTDQTTAAKADDTKASQQSVAATDGEQKASPEAKTEARETLDDLLGAFDNPADSSGGQTTQGDRSTDTDRAKTDPDIAKRLEALEVRDAEKGYRTDMDAAIKAVRGDLDPEIFDDVWIEGYLNEQARRDSRLQNAWAQRHKNPQAYQKILGSLSDQIGKKFSKVIDRQATEDREAVAAAVRGASPAAAADDKEERRKVAKMSDREFQDMKRQMGYSSY